MPPCGKGRRTFGHCCEVKMRSIREYIRKTLFDSSSILSAYRLNAPQRVKDFAFVRAPVERLADVLSRGFVLPDKDHVYSLNSQWRVYDYSYEITSLPAVNDMRRHFPPASEAFEFHGAYDAFEIYINVAPSDSGMKSYVQLASFWRGNGGAGFDVSIMMAVRCPSTPYTARCGIFYKGKRYGE